MDLSVYTNQDLTDKAVYTKMEQELIQDLKAQLEAHDIEIVYTVPNVFSFGVVCSNETDSRRYLHITIPDVREDPEWASNICLRRMSSERDWKGDAFHFCAWDEVGQMAAGLLHADYDHEIF